MATFTIAADVLPSTAAVAGFEGRDALSEPFSFDVWLVVPGASPIDLEAAVLSKATLAFEYGLLDAHRYRGVFAHVELVACVKDNALYRATLVPRFWLTTLSQHSRIFTKKNLRTIVAEVLGEYGLAEGADFEFRLEGAPAEEEHVCQYKESDFAFLSRWMEREGWYYFFEHGGDVDKLVITDNKASHESLRSSPIRYWASSGGDGSAEEAFTDFGQTLQALPARVVVRDYDYANPTHSISGAVEVTPSGVGGSVDYGARAFSQADAERIAKLRGEQLRAREKTFTGLGAATHLAAGTTFDLDLHPRPDFNQTYLVVAVTHAGHEPHLASTWGDFLPLAQGQPYAVTVDAVAADVQWRPLETAPWPHVDSFENAVVDGPATSIYAQIDDQGRYAVKFYFDEGTAKDGKASTRVRMMQPHGGSTEGWHFPLRKGTEVVCAFLGGDVDRPFIQAVAPNAETPSPVVAGNKTQNILQTGGETYLTIDDQAGSESMNLFCQKESSGLYLGVGRGEGGRSLTSNAAPPVPPAGPGGMKLGPFSFDLRTDSGHGQVYTASHLDVRAHGQFQRIAGSDVNVTLFGSLDHDVVGDADEYYHQTLKKNVTLKVTARHDDIRDQTVHKASKETFHAVFDMETIGPANYGYLCGCDRTIQGGLTDYVYFSDHKRTITGGYKVDLSPENTVIVRGDMDQTIFGGKTEKVTGELDWWIQGVATVNHNGTTVGVVKQNGATLEEGTKIEACLTGKLDIVKGTHKEKWTSAHIEITLPYLLSVYMPLVFETGYAATITLTGAKADFVGMSFQMGLLGIKMTAAREEMDASLVQLGAFTLTLKGFKLL